MAYDEMQIEAFAESEAIFGSVHFRVTNWAKVHLWPAIFQPWPSQHMQITHSAAHEIHTSIYVCSYIRIYLRKGAGKRILCMKVSLRGA